MKQLLSMLCCFVAAPLLAVQDIEQLEQQALFDAATEVSSSVVRIETIGGLEKVGQVLVNAGPTSGVVIDADGYIVSSAFNFIQRPTSIFVQLPNGQRKSAKIVSRDSSRHLVLLKIEVDKPLDVPRLSPKAQLHVGQWAVAVGRTLPGNEFNMSVGIVSAKNRIWSTAVQTDANVSPANYGGALTDIQGRVIGVLVPLSPDSSSVVAGSEWYDSGIGFAVPWEDILSHLDQLKTSDLHSGKLGVSLKGSDSYGGELIVGVSWPKSPAREAGIQAGDEIVSINDILLRRHVEMKHVLGPLLAGDRIRIRFLRDGKALTRELELTDKLLPYEHAFLGILPVRRPRMDESQGLTIRYVYEDSPASKIGIQGGDSIVAINGERVANVAGLRTAMAGFEPGVEVEITLDGNAENRRFTTTLERLPSAVPEELPAVFPNADDFNQDLPALGRVNVKLPEEAGECVAYIPDTYDPRFKHSLLVVLPMPGQTVDEVLQTWRTACDAVATILLMPQAKDVRSWLPTETAFIRKTIENLRKEYEIDGERIVVFGEHNSGAMAYLTALKHRDLVRGVAVFDSMIPRRAPALINEPLQRLAAFLLSSKNERINKLMMANGKQLESNKIPVSQKQIDDAKLDNAAREELLRWIDTLDRI